MIQQLGMHSPPPVSFDFWPRRHHSENTVLFLPGRDFNDFLLDDREIS